MAGVRNMGTLTQEIVTLLYMLRFFFNIDRG